MGFLNWGRRKRKVVSERANVVPAIKKPQPRKPSVVVLSEKRHAKAIKMLNKVISSTSSEQVMRLKATVAAQEPAFSIVCDKERVNPGAVFRKFYTRCILNPGDSPDWYRIWRADAERHVEDFIYSALKSYEQKGLTKAKYIAKLREVRLVEAQQLAIIFARLIKQNHPDAQYILSLVRKEQVNHA